MIDGQQRLTTVSLLMATLAEELGGRAEDDQEPVEGFSPRKLRNYYLLNPEETGERRYKLIQSQTDKDSLTALVDSRPLPSEGSVRITKNYELCRSLVASQCGHLDNVCKGLAKLMVVDISLDRSQDNPQLIFESMNSTGRELTQADLIRNFILMRLEPSIQERLYLEYWRPMEVGFGQVAYEKHFDPFMRHYLTVKTGEIPRTDDVYEAFKTHAQSVQARGAGIEELVADITTYAGYFRAMALGAETDGELRSAFQDLRELKVNVAYPVLLELYADYRGGLLGRYDLLAAVRLVEAYVFRRAVCSTRTNSLNNTFANFARNLRKDRYLESIKSHLLRLKSYRRFPSDEEFRREIETRDLYNFRVRTYWLRRIEDHGRKERALVDGYTVEHIMPQNENLPEAWRQALGSDWKRIHETWLHTLGNLTLTGFNSEYGDRPFREKRDMKGGFRDSPLKVNQGLGQLDDWNERSIRTRAERLSGIALQVWPAPVVPDGMLSDYEPDADLPSYSISDHPHLLSGDVRDLFEAFRKEVLSLYSCVTETFLKLYVAYKAETNFVDVIPQAKQLKLSLNIGLEDVNDPRGMCVDVSGRGRWGNGDVEVTLTSMGELPYAIGLVRQSLERQFGNGGPD